MGSLLRRQCWAAGTLAAATATGVGLLTLAGCATGDETSEPQSAPGSPTSTKGPTPERLRAEVLETLPYNEEYFTQGLEVDRNDGSLLVGTGGYGTSGLRRVDPKTGEELESSDMDGSMFGEGITQTDTGIWQLTWKSGQAILHHQDSLQPDYTAYLGGEGAAREGWGACERPGHDSSVNADGNKQNQLAELAVSHGTSELTFHDPHSFAPRGSVTVTNQGRPVDKINELECVGHDIYANVWMSTDILRIDPATGEVTAVIDASSLPNNAQPDPDNVLNGIASLPETNGTEFYLTGKRWPDLYRVRFVPEN